MIILNEKQLERVLKEYIKYYNTMRPHQGIEQNIPKGNTVCNDKGRIITVPVLGGLHHHYSRAA
jgi:hypothetical protein